MGTVGTVYSASGFGKLLQEMEPSLAITWLPS